MVVENSTYTFLPSSRFFSSFSSLRLNVVEHFIVSSMSIYSSVSLKANFIRCSHSLYFSLPFSAAKVYGVSSLVMVPVRGKMIDLTRDGLIFERWGRW